jgi:hypothetical protein
MFWLTLLTATTRSHNRLLRGGIGLAALTPTMAITPTSVKVGDKIVVKATGVGNPTQSSLTITQGANTQVVFTAAPALAGANGAMPQVGYVAGATGSGTVIPTGGTGVTGHTVNVSLNTSDGSTVTAIANDVIAAVNNDARASAIMTAALGGTSTGLGTVSAVGATAFTGGANANTTGPATVMIYHETNPNAVIVETMTIAKEGTLDSTNDFTYEASNPGFVNVQVSNTTGAFVSTQRVQVWSR